MVFFDVGACHERRDKDGVICKTRYDAKNDVSGRCLLMFVTDSSRKGKNENKLKWKWDR